MDKQVLSSLNFKQILELVQPAGDCGRHAKNHLSAYKPGQEKELRQHVQRTEVLISALDGNRKLSEMLYSTLAQTPYLYHTMKELLLRPLYLHECFEIKKFVHYALQLKSACKDAGLVKQYPFPELQKLHSLLDPDKSNTPVFSLGSSFDSKLAKCIGEINELQQAKRRAEQQLLLSAGKHLKLANLGNKVVISRQQEKRVKQFMETDYYHLADENYANLTFHLKDNETIRTLKKQISNSKQKLAKAEERVLEALSDKIRSHHKQLEATSALVVMLDWDYAKALFALRYGCCIPKISAQIHIRLKQAVNIPVKLALAEMKQNYQALDLEFDSTVNVITGPNMGGKTTVLKAIGQICLLAQFGIPVPAKEAELCLFDHIWYNRDLDSSENLSSFGREIVSLAHTLRRSGRTLYLLDELAKGTNPLEGEAILTSVLLYLAEKQCLALAATHYDKPAQLDRAAQYAIKGIDPETLRHLSFADRTTLDSQLDLLNQLMDYAPVRLGSKETPPQNALPIAQILGLPEKIVRTAKRLIKSK